MKQTKRLLLRSFYYLDERKIDDFLSAVEGTITSETIVETTKTEKGIGAEAKVPVLGAKGGLSSTNESERTIQKNSTYPGKFQKMIDYLSDEIQYYDSCDEECMLSNMKRNCVLELEGNIRMTKIDEILKTVKQFIPLLQCVQQTDDNYRVDQETISGINLVNQLSEDNKAKGIPVVLEFEDSNKYSVIFYLAESYLLSKPEAIPSPVTLFCKVQKYIKKGDKYELLNLLPTLESLAFNREQRRAMKKNIDDFPKEIRDVIKGPAIIVTPIALYN